MLNIFNTVLSELRWDDTVLLPQLSDENVDLTEKIRNVLHLLELEDDSEKNAAAFGQQLNEMFNSLKMELGDMDALIKAEEADLSFKNHCRLISERETGNMMQEKATMKREYNTLLEKKYMKEAAYFKVIEQLDECWQQEEADKKELDDLLQHSAETDLMAIHKYMKEDDKRIKSLILDTNKKKKQAEEKLKIFNKEWYETLNAEMAIDKANELMVQLFQQTKQLTCQWEKYVGQVNEWSAQNQEYRLQLFQYKLTIQEEKSKVAELTYLEKSHDSREREILTALRKVTDIIARLEHDLSECNTRELTLKTENNFLYEMLSKTNLSVEGLRCEIAKIKDESSIYLMKVEETKTENANLGEQLDAMTRITLSKDEKLADLEQLQADQELAIRRVEGTILKLMEKLNFEKKNLEAKTEEEKRFILQIARNKAAIADYESKKTKVENQIMVQESNAYKVRGEKTFVQQKLAMMQGRKEDGQKLHHLKTIAELNSAVEKVKRLATSHKKETSAAEDENCFLIRQNETLKIQKINWSKKVAELILITDTNEQALGNVLKTKCDMTAHVKVLKTEEKNMMELLLNRTDDNFSFEQTKLELQKVINVRENEIKEFMHVMKKQLKLSELERQRFAIEMKQKLGMLDKVKTQFEVKFFLVAEDDKSQAYYIIQAAQEKEELIRRKNQLDAEIHLQDNESMESTLIMYKSGNAKFNNARMSAKKQETGTHESQESHYIAETIEYKSRQIWEIQTELVDLNYSCESLLEKEKHVDKEIELKQSLISKRAKEFTLQKEKCDRVTKECSQLIKGIGTQAGTTKLKDLRNFTQTAASQLTEAVKHNPKLYQYVTNNP